MTGVPMKPDLCRWRRDDGSAHETACGNMFEFTHEGPRENGFKFCPYCGRPLRDPKPKKRGKHEQPMEQKGSQ